MQEVRCKKCNKLLAKLQPNSEGEIKCPKCNHVNTVKT